MQHIRQFIGLAGALLFTAAAACFAPAAEADTLHGLATRSVVVRYDDLDVGRPAGVEALYGRLVVAARRACGSYERRNLRAREQWHDCYTSALDDAVDRSGIGALQAMHRHPGRPLVQARQVARIR